MRITTGIAVLLGAAAIAAPAQAWQPEPATYGIAEQHNVPVTMKDGTVLRADVYSPADASGEPGAGPVPGRDDAVALRQGRGRSGSRASRARASSPT